MKNKIIKTFSFLFGIIALLQGSAANAAPWSINPHDYRYDMSLYLSFTLDNLQLNYNDYSFGAFIGDECRGIGEILNQDGMSSPVVYMRVYSNQQTDDQISFKAYDNKTKEEISGVSEIKFEAETRYGLPSDPFKFNFTIPVEKVTLSAGNSEILIGETLSLTATISPANASDKSIGWTSSKPAVATVNNGKVIGVSEGESVITATANNGVYSAITVKVLPVICESVSLDKTSYQGYKGTQVQLNATVTPANTTDKTLTWTSSNTNIAEVNNGLVSLKGTGEAVITVKCGDQTAQCNITVLAPLPESVALNPSSVTLEPNGTVTLSVVYTPSDAVTSSLTWKSDNTKVATVNDKGVVSAVAAGETIISVTTKEGKSATATVTVKNPVIEVTGVTITPASGEVFVGSTINFTASVTPDNASDKNITWKSSDVTIATVDTKGTVTGVAAGKVTITASSINGKSSSAEVNVKNVECTAITLNYKEFTGRINESLQLKAVISPDNTTVKTVTWSSMDSNIASVDQNGLVNFKNIGETSISAKCGSQTASCTVTVLPPVAESVSLSPLTAIIEPGQELQMSVALQPANAVTASLTWESSDEKVATVSDNGLVSAFATGETQITVTTAEGKTATSFITVTNTIIEVTSISLSSESLDILIGESAILTVTISPDNATDKSVSWQSSDSSIATVASGVVSGIASGEAIITATSGKVSATCKVTVNNNQTFVEVEEVILTPDKIVIMKGESYPLTVEILPEAATDKELTWTSSNAEVATVDNGVVNAIYAGTTVISATAINGVYGECSVTVHEEAGIETLFQDSYDITIYDIKGNIIKKKVDRESIKELPSGIYIIKGKDKTLKLIK